MILSEPWSWLHWSSRLLPLSLSQVFEEEGLFMWARSTELARFPRCHLAALFFGKKFNFFKWEAGLPRLPKSRNLRPRSRYWGWKFFHMTEFSPGDRDESFFDNLALLSQQQWQKWHDFWLVCFYTAEVVVKLKQSTKPYNSRKRYKFMFHHFGFVSWLTFPSEQTTTFISVTEQPGCRAHMKRP